MKLTAILLFAACMQASAGGYAQTVSIDESNTSLQKVFREIKKQTGFSFIYAREDISKALPVSINVKDVPVREVLNKCFAHQPLTYSIKNKIIVVKPSLLHPDSQLPPEQVVKGSVTDSATGQPLVGVSIKVKGSTMGTVTDENGVFSLTVQNDAMLVVSYLGYQSKTIPVNGKTKINISLAATTTGLNQLVVTALGISRKEKAVGYSLTELDGDQFTKAREPNIAYSLQGKVAGINVTKPVTGAMGSSRVIIRGNGSFNGNNQPLYVVDGVPIVNNTYGQPSTFYGGTDGGDGISAINPDDIESITVLKGGTAAALYGSRASNGAIIITTKSGSARKGVGVEWNSTYTFEKPIWYNEKDWQYKYGQGINGRAPTSQQEAFQVGSASWGAKLDGSPVVQFDGEKRPYSPVKNNVPNFYQGANTFTNTLSFYGGNKNINFRFSMSDLNNHDLMPNSRLRRNNFTLNTNATLGNNLDIQLSAMYVRERVHNRPHSADFSWNGNYTVYFLPTNYDIRTLKGMNNGLNPATGEEYQFSSNIYFANPYFIAYHETNEDATDRFIGSVNIKYSFTDAFYARALIGTNISYRNSSHLTPPESAIAAGSVSRNIRNIGEIDGQFLLGYKKQFSKWSLNAFAGGHLMRFSNKSLAANGSNFVVPNFYVLNNTSNSGKSYYLTEKQVNSLLGSAEIGFKDLLFLTITGRSDWFSTLNPENNSVFYPSASLSYILSDNLEMPQWVDYLKLRGAWAKTGSDSDVPPYAQSLTYSVSGQTYMGLPLGYVGTSTIPNKNLQPSTSTSYEAGFDIKMLDNRFDIHFTWYNRLTKSDILTSTISETSGFNSVRLNVGEIQNKGIEILLTGTPIRTNNFRWNIRLNSGYNKSLVKELLPTQASFQVAQSRPGLYSDGGVPAYIYQEVGEPYGIIKGSTYVRDEEGNIVYNANGLPKVGSIKKLGVGVAPLTIGMTNRFDYKNFYFNFLIGGKFGASLSSGTNNYSWLAGLAKVTLNGREDGAIGKGVDEQGKPNKVKVPAQQYYGFIANNISEQFVYNDDFIKLRQVVLGYQFSPKWTQRIGIQQVGIAVVARNLWTIYSKIPLIDPESSYLTGNAQGFELLALPATRSFGVNLDIKF